MEGARVLLRTKTPTHKVDYGPQKIVRSSSYSDLHALYLEVMRKEAHKIGQHRVSVQNDQNVEEEENHRPEPSATTPASHIIKKTAE